VHSVYPQGYTLCTAPELPPPVSTNGDVYVKRLLALLAMLVAGALLVTGCSSTSTGGAVQTVDPQSFLTTAAQPGTTVIDVRTPAEFAAGHVDGAVNIDVEGATFQADIGTLDKNGTYAVYCHSGRRSALATDAMSQAGFTNVYNLNGGIGDLQAAGASIVTS
jgi:phage shock protein E